MHYHKIFPSNKALKFASIDRSVSYGKKVFIDTCLSVLVQSHVKLPRLKQVRRKITFGIGTVSPTLSVIKNKDKT